MMNWETQHNNFAGMRIPGVNAGPNAGGFQAFDTPEAGVAAISHQLDRYASGATTGQPLNTLRSMVSTWAPPSENATNALITRASQVTGFSPDQQIDVSDPGTKAKLIEAFIRNEQGGKLPVGSDVISKVAANPSAFYTPGKNNNNMLPNFGNARFASDLMPKDPLGRALMLSQAPMLGGQQDDGSGAAGTGGGTASTTLDPMSVTAPQAPGLDPIMAKIQGGGGINVLDQLQQLSKAGYGFNPSATLAHMAAGFLGGRGPAASLAGGFEGLAKGQDNGNAGINELLKYSMLLGPQLQQKNATALVNAATSAAGRGKIGLGTAFKTYGLPPTPGSTYEEMDDQTPLPPAQDKQVQTKVGEIGNLSKMQEQLVNTSKQLENGEFHVDAVHQAEYWAILHDPTGYLAQAAPEKAAEAQKFNSWTQTRNLLQQTVQNAQKGALSDYRSKGALEAIVGGAGNYNDAALLNHLRLMGNNTALDINNARNEIAAAYKGTGRRVPKDFWDTYNLPKNPIEAKSIDDVYSDLYGKNYQSGPSSPSAGSPGPGANAPGGPSPAAIRAGAVPLSSGDQSLIQKYLQPQQ